MKINQSIIPPSSNRPLRLGIAGSVLFGLMLSLWASHSHGLTKAMAERTSMGENETLRLIIETDQEDQSAQIDLAPLNKNFTVLSVNSSQNLSVVNGDRMFSRRWIAELQPNTTGELSIPALSVGGETTSALTISVTAMTVPADDATLDDGSSLPDVFITTEVSPQTSYVQQRITLTARLHLGIQIANGALTSPTHPDIDIERMGDDIQYNRDINGRTYLVVERQYVAFARKSGDFSIAPIEFSGRRQSGRQSMMNSFFNTGDPVRFRSQTMDVSIKSANDAFHGKIWLPATDLILSDLSSNNPDTIQVGQPINRQIQIRAIGLTGEQLPQIDTPDIDNAKLYWDQPIFDTQIINGEIVGTRTQSVAVIPNDTGLFTFPSLSLKWWDIESDQPREAFLAPINVNVAVSESTAPQLPSPDVTPPSNSVSSERSNADSPSRSGNPETSLWIWQLISGLLGIALVLTLIFLRRITSKQSQGLPPAKSTHNELNLKQWAKQVVQACNGDAPKDARAAIVGWAKAGWGIDRPVTLNEITERLDDPSLQSAIRELDAALYGDNATSWDGGTLLSAFKKLKPIKHDGHFQRSEKRTPLPDLYPSPTGDRS